MNASDDLIGKLQATLDGAQKQARDEARAFMSTPELAPPPPGSSKDVQRDLTLGKVKRMVEAGFTQLPYDTAVGGAGRYRDYMNIVDIISHSDLSLAVKQGVQFGLFGLGLYSLGTQKHHDAYMKGIMQGQILGGFAMTEMAGGSDVQGVATEAVYDHATRSFKLTTPNAGAKKAYIGNAALHGEMMVVFAQLKMSPDAKSEGVHAFIVPVRDKAAGQSLPGVTIEDCGDKIGLNGVDNGYLSFDNVTLPYDALLDRFAQIDADGVYQSPIAKRSERFFKMISTLVTGRVFVGMAANSAAKTALTAATDFAASRVVFGDALVNKPATHARLLPPIATAYAHHFATRYLLDQQIAGSPEVETLAAALKSAATDDSITTIDEMRKLTGGHGYMSHQRYGALRADVDIFRTFEGDNTILRMLVAKNRLTGMAAEFNAVSGIGKAVKMAGYALRNKLARFNSAARRTREGHLLSAGFHREIFTTRERMMKFALSQKLRTLAKKQGLKAAMDACQRDMLAYADAYADRVMVERFAVAVAAEQDPAARAALEPLSQLFAVNRLRKHGLWFVENGLMSPAKTRALATAEEGLYARIAPLAQVYTKAFGVPAQALQAADLAPSAGSAPASSAPPAPAA